MTLGSLKIIRRTLLMLFIFGTVAFCFRQFLNEILANENSFHYRSDGSQVGSDALISANYAVAGVWFRAAIYFLLLGVGIIVWWTLKLGWKRRRQSKRVGFEVQPAKTKE